MSKREMTVAEIVEHAAKIADEMADGLLRDAAYAEAAGLSNAPITVEQVVNGYRMIAKLIRKELA